VSQGTCGCLVCIPDPGPIPVQMLYNCAAQRLTTAEDLVQSHRVM